MEQKEVKVKMRFCRICNNEFNKYSRPRGARFTCSDGCQEAWMGKVQESRALVNEARKKKRRARMVAMLITSIITGIIGALLGNYIFYAMGMIGDPGVVILIGFAVGFFGPLVAYICQI
ncbi:MAG: hypothetical protein ACFFDN_21790 [Candidatus Hodarchaeota archaeon]